MNECSKQMILALGPQTVFLLPSSKAKQTKSKAKEAKQSFAKHSKATNKAKQSLAVNPFGKSRREVGGDEKSWKLEI